MACFGFAYIHAHWKDDVSTPLSMLFLGWFLVLCASALMFVANGFEFGMVYILCGFAFIPIIISALNMEIRPQTKDRSSTRQRLSIDKKRYYQNIAIFFILIPISFTLSLLFTLQISSLLPWSTINKLTLIVLGFPILWSVIIYLILYAKRKRLWSGIALFSTLSLCAFTFL